MNATLTLISMESGTHNPDERHFISDFDEKWLS